MSWNVCVCVCVIARGHTDGCKHAFRIGERGNAKRNGAPGGFGNPCLRRV